MRDRDTVDAELRLLAAVRAAIREQGGEPSSRQVDELLDERGLSAQAEGFELLTSAFQRRIMVLVSRFDGG